MIHDRIIRYGVSVNPLYTQIASTTELKKKTLIGFHLLAVRINRINRTMGCPPIYNGHLPISDLLREVCRPSHSESEVKFTHYSHCMDLHRNYVQYCFITSAVKSIKIFDWRKGRNAKYSILSITGKNITKI